MQWRHRGVRISLRDINKKGVEIGVRQNRCPDDRAYFQMFIDVKWFVYLFTSRVYICWHSHIAFTYVYTRLLNDWMGEGGNIVLALSVRHAFLSGRISW